TSGKKTGTWTDHVFRTNVVLPRDARGKGTNAEERLEPLIHVVRGQRVILDADLAPLYGVRRRSAASAFSAAFSSASTLRKSGADRDFRVFSAPAPRRRPRREVSSMQLLCPSAPCRSWCMEIGGLRGRT